MSGVDLARWLPAVLAVPAWPASIVIVVLAILAFAPRGRQTAVLSSAAEISAVLKDLFGVVMPDEAAFAARLAQLGWPDFSAS